MRMSQLSMRVAALLSGVALAICLAPTAAGAQPVGDAQDLVIEAPAQEISLGNPAGQGAPEESVKAASGQYATFSLPVTGTVRYDYAWQVLSLVNQQREASGLAALTMDQGLLDTAVLRSAETVVLFSHDRPNGQDCFSAFPSGSTASGENIAMGQTSPSQVMTSWMNSQGHRQNILNGSYTTIGISCLEVNGSLYWVQCFGNRLSGAASRPGNQTVTQQVQVAPEAFGLEVSVVATSSDGKNTVSLPSKVAAGSTQHFALVVEDSSGDLYEVGDATRWSSSSQGVATIDASGTATFRASGKTTITATTSAGLTASVDLGVTVLKKGEGPVYRLYNVNSGLHHYTTSSYERDHLVSLGWRDEGASFWVSIDSGTRIYRNYNPNDGNHNWTQSAYEHNYLTSIGWDDEGTAWYIPAGASSPVYRLYNPNSGEHVYTMSKFEYDRVVAAGWQGEDIAWMSL